MGALGGTVPLGSGGHSTVSVRNTSWQQHRPAPCLAGVICAAGPQFPGFYIVLLECVDDMEQPLAAPRVQHGTGNLDRRSVFRVMKSAEEI